MPWDDGWLAWCLPQLAFVPTPEEKLDRLDILRHFGRIGMVGVDPAAGFARWDANACHLWGFDPTEQRPSLAQVIASIHDDDRPRVVELFSARAQAVGYASERFRVRLKTGKVRHLHAMLKVVDDTKTADRYLAQRKVAEEAMNALELAGVAVWRQNLTGKARRGVPAARLRGEPQLAATRCIALSANNSPGEIQRARAAGFDDYWTKPLDTHQFLRGLDDLSQSPHGPNASR